MRQIKIAFSGLMRSGKDACGDYIIKKHGGVIKRFAEPLYDIMHYAQRRCRLPETKWRKFLQVVGTELFRAEHPGIWVNLLIEEVVDLDPSVNIIVVDARFNDEFEALKKAGFLLVKIIRTDAEREAEERVSSEVARHASEVDMLSYEGFDHVIVNCGTLEDLYRSVDRLIESQFREEDPCHWYDPEVVEGADDKWAFIRGMKGPAPDLDDFGHPI
jgi:hypothetical protein